MSIKYGRGELKLIYIYIYMYVWVCVNEKKVRSSGDDKYEFFLLGRGVRDTGH